jgi:enoyl-CoA hydratase/carnithine racemase
VLVGVTDQPSAMPPAGFDLLLTRATGAPRPWVTCIDGTEAVLGRLATAVTMAPLAAVALIQLLRATEGMAIPDALVAESFAYSSLQDGPEFTRWFASRVRRPTRRRPGPAVSIERRDAELTITLARPRLHNVYDAVARDELHEALSLVAADDSLREVHLRATGPDFCIGGDLREFGTRPDPSTAHAIRTTRSPAQLLALCSARITAYVHGRCIGAGVELPSFAGRVVASSDTTFRLPEVAMGLIPGAGGTVSVTNRVGRQRLGYLALTGDTLDARRAHEWGLVDEVTDDEVAASR